MIHHYMTYVTYSMVNTINEPTFYHAGGSSSIDVILTNQKRRLNTHLSDGHMLMMRLSAPKQPPRTIVNVYPSFKTFREIDFIDDLSRPLFMLPTLLVTLKTATGCLTAC